MIHNTNDFLVIWVLMSPVFVAISTYHIVLRFFYLSTKRALGIAQLGRGQNQEQPAELAGWGVAFVRSVPFKGAYNGSVYTITVYV